MKILLITFLLFNVVNPHQLSGQSPKIPVPTISGAWRPIAKNPDLGKYNSQEQEPVDFGGRWHVATVVVHSQIKISRNYFHDKVSLWVGRKILNLHKLAAERSKVGGRFNAG